jgi:AraC family transcriptional regulator
MKPQLSAGNFYGAISRTRTIASCSLTETAYPSGHRLPAHSHGIPYFCFVLQGRFAETYCDRDLMYGPGILTFHPPGETHSDIFHTNVRCLNVELHERSTHEDAQQMQRRDFHGGTPSYLATKVYREFCEPDELSDLAIEGLVLEMIVESVRAAKKKDCVVPIWLESSRELLHAHFAERITVAELASTLGVHPTHLAREFRRHFKRTVGEYVRMLRIDFARRELCQSTIPITQIALTAGFFDQSHFARTFKQLTGMPPALYREKFRSR